LWALTPWGWALAAVIAVGLLLALAGGLGLRWDPFDTAGRRLRAAEARAETAMLDAAARRLEVEAAAEQAARLDTHHQQAVAVGRATARAAAQARSAHDADTPLDPDRTARLAGHDRELCRLAPDICRPAAPDPAARGVNALRPAAPAG
jgi:hypothetical protein